MQECLSGHQSCNKPPTAESTWYPSRLLQIGLDNKIRLTCTADIPPIGPYVTLSHCWGKVPLIQLLRSNMEAFRLGITKDDLPKTFQDALVVTRRLGVSYLWIDSLCILQDKDDLSDWAKESAMMGRVYSNSYCNISASAAVDSSRGLFFPRSATPLCPLHITASIEIDSDDLRKKRYSLHNVLIWRKNIEESPLNSRGWG